AAMLLLAGRPDAASATLRAAPGGINDIYIATRFLADAAIDHGDSIAALQAERILLPLASAPTPRDSAALLTQRSAIRAILTWRLSRGDTTSAKSLLTKLRSMTPHAGATPSVDEIAVATYDALLADRTARPEAPRLTAVLDSMLANADYPNG